MVVGLVYVVFCLSPCLEGEDVPCLERTERRGHYYREGLAKEDDRKYLRNITAEKVHVALRLDSSALNPGWTRNEEQSVKRLW